MAVQSLLYNHTMGNFLKGNNLEADVYKINLYSSFVFNASATTKTAAEVGCTQLSTANGYTQNAKTLAGVIVNITGNDCNFDANDVQWTASGGTLAAVWAMVFNDTKANDPPVLAVNFDANIAAVDGANFDIIWNAAGIIAVTVP